MNNYLETRFVRSFWYERSPKLLQNKLIRRLCGTIYSVVRKQQKRIPEATYTCFFRNRAQLSVLNGVVSDKPLRAKLKMAVLGCSTGAELYSALYTIAQSRADIDIDAIGLDISSDAIEAAKEGQYGVGAREMQGVSETEQSGLFVREEDQLKVKDEFMRRAQWAVGNACDPRLIESLEPQDIVLANNFLIHLEDQMAEKCFRNIVNLVRPGGFLLVWGSDLDIRSRLASELKLDVIDQYIREVHQADEKALRLYPWLWWTLEPINTKREDWKTRYGTVFRVP